MFVLHCLYLSSRQFYGMEKYANLMERYRENKPGLGPKAFIGSFDNSRRSVILFRLFGVLEVHATNGEPR